MDAAPPLSRPLLIVGYGNTLREDDGVGPHVACQVGELGLPGVEILACPQLSPEHAAILARARTVIFVDASMDGSATVRLRRLLPGTSVRVTTHSAEPRTLLALARELYGRAPRAWMLALPARRMGYGDELSFTAERGMEAAVRIIRRFVQVRKLRQAPVCPELSARHFLPEFDVAEWRNSRTPGMA